MHRWFSLATYGIAYDGINIGLTNLHLRQILSANCSCGILNQRVFSNAGYDLAETLCFMTNREEHHDEKKNIKLAACGMYGVIHASCHGVCGG